MASFITAGNATNGLQVSSDNTGILQLKTGTGSGTTAVTFDTGQRATFPSTISVGNTTPATTGAGITFPAAQSASSDANTLDDYEEGTFTPVALGSTTGGTASYTVQIGRYTKIGNRVFYSLYINYSGGTGSGFMRIGGLPFTSNSTANNYSMGSIYFSNLALTANNIALAFVVNNDTTISINQTPAGGGAATEVNYDATALLLVSGHYEV